MIETERQRQAALSWIRYWNESVSAGEQSWLGQEQALETIMALHQQVNAYERRVGAVTTAPKPDDMQVTTNEAAESVPVGAANELVVVPSELQDSATLGATSSPGAQNGQTSPTTRSAVVAASETTIN